jgi:hypothetical protein
MTFKATQIEYHRNGVSGDGFYAVLFKDKSFGKGNFLANVFDDKGHIAVINLDLIAELGIGQGNKWRSDVIENKLIKAIKEHIGCDNPFE